MIRQRSITTYVLMSRLWTVFTLPCCEPQRPVRYRILSGKMTAKRILFLYMTRSRRRWDCVQGWEDLLHLADLAARSTSLCATEGAANKVPGLPAESLASHPLVDIADAVERDGPAWQSFCALPAPENAPLPGGLPDTLTTFERLLVRMPPPPPFCAQAEQCALILT